ncbi:MAG: DUF2752 domain-containing protein [Acidimicrobiia bacterium]
MSRRVVLWWEDHDRHRAMTRLAGVGLIAALLMALFGQPPYGFHGPLHYLGVMSPTCGMSRGVMWLMRGKMAMAWEYNPASLLVLPVGAVAVVRSVFGRFTNRWPNLTVRLNWWMLVLVIVAVATLTVRQQLKAELLM